MRLTLSLLCGLFAFCSRLHAPIHIGIDYRPAVRAHILKAISQLEHCMSLNNPGCLIYAGQQGAQRGPNGYAHFRSLELGQRAMERQWDRLQWLPIREALGRYNPRNPRYADLVLERAGVR